MKSLFLRVLMVGVALGVIGCTDNKHPIENAEGTRRPLVSGPASPGVSYQPDPGGVAPVEVLTPPANVYYDQSNVPPDPSLEFAVALPGPGPQSASAWTTRDEFALAQAFQVLRVSDRSGFQAIAETVASPGRPGANGLGRGAIRSLPLAATGPAVYIVRFKEGTYLGRPFAAARPGKGEKYSWPSDYAARYNHPDLLWAQLH